MHVILLGILAMVSLILGCLIGVIVGVMYHSLIIPDQKIRVEKDGYVDVELEEKVCIGYRDVEAE
jgi:hypothetical protein